MRTSDATLRRTFFFLMVDALEESGAALRSAHGVLRALPQYELRADGASGDS